MITRDVPEAPSPSASSIRLPLHNLALNSRRNSIVSLSARSYIDKDTLSQTLDNIHTSASRSSTLTTFDDFAPPPPSTLTVDSKGIASDIVQGGLSGLYNRIRATVGGAKDAVISAGSSGDFSPARSALRLVKTSTGTTLSSPVLVSAPSSRLQSPLETTFPDSISSTSKIVDRATNSPLPSPRILSADTRSPLALQPKSKPSVATSIPEPLILSHMRDEVSRSQSTTSLNSKSKDSSLLENSQHESERKSAAQSALASSAVSSATQSIKSEHIPPDGFPLAHKGDADWLENQQSDTEEDIAEALKSASHPQELPPKPADSVPVVQRSAPRREDEFMLGAQSSRKHERSASGTGMLNDHESDRGSSRMSTGQGSGDVPRIQRPSLTRIGPSHLPGYLNSTASSSDGLSSIATVAPSRHATFQTPDEQNLRLRSDNDYFNAPSQMKRRVLSREFWMRDENAKDCFYCGDTFTTFRRKHHCRTCGQIFDDKCTSLVSGKHFGQSGRIRVCKPCESILYGNDDDSSVYTDDADQASLYARDAASRQQLDSTEHSNLDMTEKDTKAILLETDHMKMETPTISIPMSRKPGERKHRSTVIELDAPPSLPRPSSSRSLRSLNGRPWFSGHKRHHSRHQHMKSLKHEDRAPFQSHNAEENRTYLPAFHHDNIIDPDLAPFMSDEESDENEPMSIFAALAGDSPQHASGGDSDRTGLSGLISAIKKGKSRTGDRPPTSSHAPSGRDADTISLSGRRMSKHVKKRNLSVSNFGFTHLSPKRNKSANILKSFTAGLPAFVSQTPTLQVPATPSSIGGGSKLIRSASMRGAYAPVVELNQASRRHVRKLLKQLLQDVEVPQTSSWERTLMPILLRCTDDVTPDVQHDDDIDIRNYIKLKKIPGGKAGDTSYVSGVVFSKNVALKSMPRSIPNPRIVIVTFAIEYTRHQQHFMSLEPVIAQEREYLRNLVNRITALSPHVLLVERNVAGVALKFLEEAGITVVSMVKPSVLNAVARCTQTRIISSVDGLATDPSQLGHCESFEVKTYVNKGIKKTYIYFSGCQRELGCTIVLRGASTRTLIKLKRITEFMCYVVYNLKLETCLMRDEFVLIPTSAPSDLVAAGPPSKPISIEQLPLLPPPPSSQTKPEDKLPSSETETQKNNESNPEEKSKENSSGQQNTTTTASDSPNDQSIPDESSVIPATTNNEIQIPDDVPTPSFYDEMVEKHRTKILSASPFVQFIQPYLLTQAREQERKIAYLKRLRDRYSAADQEKNEPDDVPSKFELVQPEMVHTVVDKAPKQVREFLHAVHSAEYDKAMQNYLTQKRQWEAYVSGYGDVFNPFNHQRIAVLYSVVNSETSTPCIGPEVIALNYYDEHDLDDGFAADCTLGQYVEDLCHGAHTICDSVGCDRKMLDHHRQYVHGEGQMSVIVQKYPSRIRGLNNTILMWSCCRICGQETQVIPMSDNTWRYSFGKYLELTFWSTGLHPRADVCPHDIHKNHVRYFGLNNVALRIQYDTIQLYEVTVPRPIVMWKVDKDLRLKNEQYLKIEERLDRFMCSVRARLKSIHVESVVPEKVEDCRDEVEKLTKRVNEEHEWCLRKLQEKYINSRYYEIIPLNRAIRAIQEKAIEWDDTFADFERQFFPSEKDIRRLAALQLRKLFLERDESTNSLTSVDEANEEENENDHVPMNEKGENVALTPRRSQMSEKQAHDVLNSVVNEDQTCTQAQSKSEPALKDNNVEAQVSSPKEALAAVQSETVERQEVRHLDLAIPSGLSEVPPKLENDILNSPPIKPVLASANDIPAEPLLEGSRAVKGTNLNTAEQGSSNEITTQQQSEGLLESKIPRLIDTIRREGAGRPPMNRTHSQPGGISRRETAMTSSSSSSSSKTESTKLSLSESARFIERRMADFKSGMKSKVAGHSMIPRSVVPSRKRDSRVLNLAKHFDQISREFEIERLRERRQRAERSKQARAYPLASSKPIVEVYRDVHEAARENDEDSQNIDQPRTSTETSTLGDSSLTETTDTRLTGDTTPERSNTFDSAPNTSQEGESQLGDTRIIASTSDIEGEASDIDNPTLEEIEIPDSIADSQILSPAESDSQLDLSLDLPKHEKTSLMRMLTSFWSERSASSWTPLDYPFAQNEHVWEDSDIIVREDEPSSVIALALSSPDYLTKLESFRAQVGDMETELTALDLDEASIEHNLLHQANTNIRYGFTNRGVRAQCKIFYAQSFDALRRKCGVADRFVESLSRCLKWDSKGGKTKSLFLKTLDDRFVLKSLSPIEVNAFFKFAPNYFAFTHQNLFKGLPSVIAKMFGLFQVQIRTPNGRDFDSFMLVMENLFYDREPNRRFDLKGSMRNRKIQSTGERDEVLLDENLVDIIYSEKPIFVREHTKKLLKASVWNDTLFLSKQNVMDYSLMAGFDDTRREIIVGIIDCIRTYTWDKKLETWIKDRGKNKPTITSPKDYRSRFRIAMAKYILQAPNCWYNFQGPRLDMQPQIPAMPKRSIKILEKEDDGIEDGFYEVEDVNVEEQ